MNYKALLFPVFIGCALLATPGIQARISIHCGFSVPSPLVRTTYTFIEEPVVEEIILKRDTSYSIYRHPVRRVYVKKPIHTIKIRHHQVPKFDFGFGFNNFGFWF